MSTPEVDRAEQSYSRIVDFASAVRKVAEWSELPSLSPSEVSKKFKDHFDLKVSQGPHRRGRPPKDPRLKFDRIYVQRVQSRYPSTFSASPVTPSPDIQDDEEDQDMPDWIYLPDEDPIPELPKQVVPESTTEIVTPNLASRMSSSPALSRSPQLIPRESGEPTEMIDMTERNLLNPDYDFSDMD